MGQNGGSRTIFVKAAGSAHSVSREVTIGVVCLPIGVYHFRAESGTQPKSRLECDSRIFFFFLTAWHGIVYQV